MSTAVRLRVRVVAVSLGLIIDHHSSGDQRSVEDKGHRARYKSYTRSSYNKLRTLLAVASDVVGSLSETPVEETEALRLKYGSGCGV